MARVPPLVKAILADANRVAPGRNRASDGAIGDAKHAREGGDHNPDSRGIVHAADVTNDPAHGMDTWQWAQKIANRIKSGQETRVKYLVSNDGDKDVIFNPSVSMTWRQNGRRKQDHRSHLHTSIKSGSAVENNTAPYFVGSSSTSKPKPPPVPEDDDMKLLVKGDQQPHYYMVEGNTKRWLESKFHVDQWLAPQPPAARKITLAQATVDQIPPYPGTPLPPDYHGVR